MSSFVASLNGFPPYLTSFSLGLVAAIPNHTIRYSALGFIFCFSVFYAIHLKSPSTQLHNLATMIDETDELLRRAMAQANKMASLIKCRILTSEGDWFSCNNYRVLSNTIGECAKRAKKVRTEVELIMEAEHQRKIEDDLNKMQLIFAVWSAQTAPHTASQYCSYRQVRTYLPTYLPTYRQYSAVDV
ncbi:hypothetical protein K438DRAFT_1758559 [Mycena galopus ATCC 62051]|nr:hypothetical protein K438DRAFT_1758559 [Mycena galopus ATCC 62051]